MFIVIVAVIGCSHSAKMNSSIYSQNKVSNHEDSDFFKPFFGDSSTTIAIVFPSKVIGKYAIDATNASLSYLIYKNSSFKIKIFDMVNEDKDSVEDIFSKISQENISKIIVLCTYDGAKYLTTVDNLNNYDIYLPLIHKSVLDLNLKYVTYGSIDYSKQFDKLLQYSNEKVINFYDNSNLGEKLTSSLARKDIKHLYHKKIDNDNGKYHKFLNVENKQLLDSTLVVNMPIVKSSIILSQVNVNDINVSRILSTQLNYTPLLLSFTQVEDRENMIIANSIGKTNRAIEEYNAILESDINYNWVNYSTIIGIQYLIDKNLKDFDSISVISNQIEYPVKLFTTTKHSFQLIDSL
jgi:hypothetical protein